MNKEQDLKTMYLLKIKELRHLICTTTYGPLEVKILKDEPEYFFTLDAIPLPKETNKELLKLYNING